MYSAAKYSVTVGLNPEFRELLLRIHCDEISEQIKQMTPNFMPIY